MSIFPMLRMDMFYCLKLFAIVIALEQCIDFKVEAEHDCGNLMITNRYLTIGATVNIRFIPNTGIKPMVDMGLYRWFCRNNTGRHIIYRKGSSQDYDRRLSEDNYVLTIKDVQRRDEGQYQVECWYRSSTSKTIYIYSNPVDLKLQEPLQTTTKTTDLKTHSTKDSSVLPSLDGHTITISSLSTTKEAEKAEGSSEKTELDDSGNSTSVMIGVVAAVVVVLVIIVVIILRRRRAVKRAYNQNDERAGFIDTNVGNDLAIPQDHPLGFENAALDIDPYNTIDQPITRPGVDIKNAAEDDNFYNTIDQPAARPNEPVNRKASYMNVQKDANEYSKVIPKSLRTKGETEQAASANHNGPKEAEYASVIPKSKRNQKDTGNVNNGKSDTETSTAPAPMEENVKEISNTAFRHSTENILEYSTILPKYERGRSIDINCEYSKPIPKEQRFLDIHGLDNVDGGVKKELKPKHHVYDTPSPINKHRKGGLKELQYVEIEHSNSSLNLSQSSESLTAKPIQYVDIDFSKKAFIAPKRYPPPSSPKVTGNKV